MLKRISIVVGVIVAVLIAAALILPFFINANTFKPMLESELTGALGRKVQIGNIRLSIFSGGVTVDSVSIADDPAFSSAPFLTAKQLTAGASLLPLIFSHRLDITSITITDPRVSLLRSSAGRWNFSSLGASGSGAAPDTGKPGGTSAPLNDFSVGSLKLSNGTITVGSAGSSRVRTYDRVDLDLSNFSFASRFPFRLTASTPGGGTIQLDGEAGPVNPSDASLTPLQASLAIERLDLETTGFIDPSSGIGGVIGFHGTLASDGQTMRSKGTLTANGIRFAPNARPATVPVSVDYNANYNLRTSTGTLGTATMHAGKAIASLGGTYDASGAVTSVRLQLQGKAMPVADLQGLLPAAGIELPAGASLQSGALDLNLSITGPLDKLVIAGPVLLSNARLAGFDLKGKLGALAAFTALGRGGAQTHAGTEIQKLSTNLQVDAAGTHARNLELIVPALGTITGAANVSAAGSLQCQLLAKLATTGVAGAVSSALASLTRGATSGGIPFQVTGTTAKPVFRPELGRAAAPAQGTAANRNSAAGEVSGILGRLLNKKPSK